MKYFAVLVIIAVICFACKNSKQNTNDPMKYLTENLPGDKPEVFKPSGISEELIIHRGIFSKDFEQYYYTVSDENFLQFDVMLLEKNGDQWSAPKPAFFNSEYSEHGMSFSPDGNTVYFSSTRPVDLEGVASTWHIWKSVWQDGHWTEPVYVDIPNLSNQLTSHPSVTHDGTLYFHSANLDYSNMDIYYSVNSDGQYLPAQKLDMEGLEAIAKCTPYVHPEEAYLIVALIDSPLELIVCKKGENGQWRPTKKLSDDINFNGQGNPTVSPDHKYLFFAVGDFEKNECQIKWVQTAALNL